MVIHMAETITIPKEEYNELIELKRFVELEYERPLSDGTLRKIRKIIKEMDKGKYTSITSEKQFDDFFDQL